MDEGRPGKRSEPKKRASPRPAPREGDARRAAGGRGGASKRTEAGRLRAGGDDSRKRQKWEEKPDRPQRGGGDSPRPRRQNGGDPSVRRKRSDDADQGGKGANREGAPSRAQRSGRVADSKRPTREVAPGRRRPSDGEAEGRGRVQRQGLRGRSEGQRGEPEGFGPFRPPQRPATGRARRADEPIRRASTGERMVRSAAQEAVARGATPKARSALRLVGGTERGEEAPAKRPTRKAATSPVPWRAGSRETIEAPRPRRPAREGARLTDAIARAARAVERGYEREAVRILRPLLDGHPDAPDVRELLGVAYYRLGRWALAQKELDAYIRLTGSTEQHPVRMDCARALGRHRRVAELWEELRAASPGADIVTEGRIVAAGSLADRGRLREAIGLLERAPAPHRRTAPHHVRLWYALADLHERAGDLPAARALFRRVSAEDPSFVDVAERLAALS